MYCPVYSSIDSADDASAEIMAMVIEDDEGYSPVGAAQALASVKGADFSVQDIRDHRAKNCSCSDIDRRGSA